MAGGQGRRTKAHRIISIVLVASALLAGATARADQINASSRPRVNGPLSPAASACGEDRAKHEGKTIAKVESCLRLYEFDALMETDPLRTYGVGWVQTTVNPVNGWCATKVDSTMMLPDSVTQHSSAPARKIEVDGPSRATVKITTDAAGHALQNGSVAQSFTLFPKLLKPDTSNGGRTLTTTWKGRESSTLAFALGAEISWQILETPNVRGGLGNMSFVKSRGC